ncbi:MAG: hypothetical protein GX094_04430 [Clostridiales bacterium]|jgi:hypothetical protein|nr:hypothetical protein [Clostridiales bacterium]
MISQSLKETIKNVLNTSCFKIDEIRSGFSKRVYKIITQTDSFILYIWCRPYDNKLTENKTKGIDYLFPDGFAYFVHNTQLLTDMGVRVPYILTAGHHDDGDFDYAIDECFKGQSLHDYMRNGGNVGDIADKIMAVMDRMASKKRIFYGPPMENKPNDISEVQLVFNFTAEELNIASKLDNEVSVLQPNVLQNGEIGLIDIEGIKFFDIEYDWAVINLVYGDTIPLPKFINTEKLEFYKLCLKIGYISAATDYLKNVDGNDKWFRNVRESNLCDIKRMLLSTSC